MKTYIMECRVEAQTAIIHNGGETDGNFVSFRKMKVFYGDKMAEVPYLSGNSIRNRLRVASGKFTLLTLGESDKPFRASVPLAYLIFSGGSPTKEDKKEVNDDMTKRRNIKNNFTHLAMFGGSVGNAILAGKMKINPLVPISKETADRIPAEFHLPTMKSVFSYLQIETLFTHDIFRDKKLEAYIEKEEDKKIPKSQMLYHVENLAIGTPFYWKVVLEDVTLEEYDFFLTVFERFKKMAIVGGKQGIGYGQLAIVEDSMKWTELSKEGAILETVSHTTESLYQKMLIENKANIKAHLNTYR